MRALVKLSGRLVIAEVTSSTDQGHCPVCYGVTFEDAPYGWVECATCRDYAILKSDLQRITQETS